MGKDHYNSKFALLFAPKDNKRWAVTLGQHTWYSVQRWEVEKSWRNHEDCHKYQFKKYGVVGFLLMYLWEYVAGRWDGKAHTAAYRDISFEVEARAAETGAFLYL
jgi:hypothetical protein